MATILDTFITRFGFETDKTGLNQAKKGLGDFKASAIKIAAAVGSILAGGFFLKKIAEAADETLKWADANNIVIESLGELEFAARRQGGTNEGLRGSLSNINAAIGEVSRGVGRAKIAFEAFGLTIKKANGETKTADELLVDLNKKFATLSATQQFDLAKKIGIDQGTIRLLQTAPDEIARLRKEAARLGVLSRQDAVKAAEFVDGLTNIGQALQAIKFEIAGFLFEPLAKFFRLIADGIAFFRKHKDILLTIIGIIGLVGLAYLAMGIKAGIAWLIALGPLVLIPFLVGLAIAAIVLIGEEFIAFFKGQDSLLGDYVKKWPALGDVIFAVRDAVKIIGAVSKVTFKLWLGAIGLVIDEFIVLWGWIKTIKALIAIVPGFKKFTASINIDTHELRKLKTRSDGGDAPKESVLLKPIDFLLQRQPISIAGILMKSFLTGLGNKIRGGPATEIRIGEVNIDAPGADSKEIAENVGAALRRELQNTVEDFDSNIKE